MTIGENISRIRVVNKLQNADVKMSDRVIYNMMITARDWLIKNEDDKKALLRMAFLFKKLEYVELIETDTIEACGIDSECLIMRSKDKLPKMVKAAFGEIIKSVTSIDGKIDLNPTTRKSFNRKLDSDNYKYNEDTYYFIENDYIYLANADWDAISIYGFFEDPAEIDALNSCHNKDADICTPIKEREFACPSYLVAKIVEAVNAEIMNDYNRLKEDTTVNKNPNA